MVPLADGVHVPALFQLTVCNINSQFSMPSVRMMVFAELIYRFFLHKLGNTLLIDTNDTTFLICALVPPPPSRSCMRGLLFTTFPNHAQETIFSTAKILFQFNCTV